MARTARSGAAIARQRHAPVDRACRSSGIARRWCFPIPRSPRPISASPASRCPAFPASSSAATATSRGDSPTPAATGATSFASSPIRAMPKKYLTPDGPKAFEVFNETIAAKGGRVEDGADPLDHLGTDRLEGRARPRVRAALARARRASARLGHHQARSARDRSTSCCRPSPGLGIPNQNVTMADTAGRIAWTIGGAIPRRVGHDGMTPESWADGTHRWDGYLAGRGVSAHRRSGRRPHLDRERARRRWRHARGDRRRRLCRRHPRAD